MPEKQISNPKSGIPSHICIHMFMSMGFPYTSTSGTALHIVCVVTIPVASEKAKQTVRLGHSLRVCDARRALTNVNASH
ncbi:hypothetical protein KQX54_011274 [Cotesia glomerata]|uniref:Uncharacterized protein n=1 Tax=Cotesia glomerata TaxID=32391 RepID=A0AAV7J395_COTGL|nr:hypothetical protein KQX54_011274 [Cotesia glomerata]